MGYKEVWVDENLDEFDDNELIEELEGRGYTVYGPEGYSEINELYKDYTAYGYSEKFRNILENFFEITRT